MSERILVVEDEVVLLSNLCEMLERAGYEVEGAADAESALERVLEQDFPIVLTDIRLPKMDGVELLNRILAERPDTFVILTTAFASIETAVEALRRGAYDYLLKPIAFEDLRRKLEQLAGYRALKNEVSRLRRDLHSRLGFEGIVGESKAIKQVFDLIEHVAPTRATVLITGESGTGKELVARGIHAHSSVRDKEFMAINMAALPADMVEGQLFGHEKGAFTSAEKRREGLLRSVSGGTVFLDEIGELTMGAQSKLLRAIENREILPVGADRPVAVDFRLIAATNQDLEAVIREGRFRQDLYFRLNVFRIDVPPLRRRREDIPPLVSHFVRLHCRNLGRPPLAVPDETMKFFFAYSWPGNVRELSNVIERAAILATGNAIGPEHLPQDLQGAEVAPTDLRLALQAAERQHIAFVLHATGGAREKAAELLGIDPATLYRKTLKYDLD